MGDKCFCFSYVVLDVNCSFLGLLLLFFNIIDLSFLSYKGLSIFAKYLLLYLRENKDYLDLFLRRFTVDVFSIFTNFFFSIVGLGLLVIDFIVLIKFFIDFDGDNTFTDC